MHYTYDQTGKVKGRFKLDGPISAERYQVLHGQIKDPLKCTAMCDVVEGKVELPCERADCQPSR